MNLLLFNHNFHYGILVVTVINLQFKLQLSLFNQSQLKFILCYVQELHDIPLFVSLHNLCSTLKCTSPSAVLFRSAVLNAGYRISGSHVNPLGLKTDAPMDVVWDIMRCWVVFLSSFLLPLMMCVSVIFLFPLLRLLSLQVASPYGK